MEPLLPLVLPLLAALMPQVLEVRGTTRCPSAADVGDRMGSLQSAETVPPLSDWLELRDVPSRAPNQTDLELRLNRAGLSTPLGVRRLARGQSCAETVDAVAVIAASWLATFPTPTPEPPPIPTGAASRVRPDADPEEPRTESATATVQATRSPRTAPSRFAVGAGGGLVTGATGGSAASIQIEGEVALQSRWVLRLSATGTGSRDVPLGAGEVSWQRVAVFPAVMAVWRTTAAAVEIGAGPLMALTRARGQGFPANGSDTAPNIGAAPTARVGRRLNPLPITLWLSATANLWLRPPQVQVDSVVAGGTSTVSLPWWDAALVAGLTFSLGR